MGILKSKKNAGPVAVTIESERLKGGKVTGKIGTKFAYGGLAFDKLQFKPDGDSVLEASMIPCPGALMTFKGGKGADVGIEYVQGSLIATSEVDVKDMSKVSSTASILMGDGIRVGGGASYSLKGSGFSAFDVGATYSSGPLYTSITTMSKMSQVKAAITYKVNSSLSIASLSTHSKAKPLDDITVGGIYKSAAIGNIKAKVNKSGIVSACIIKPVAPKVSLTVSGTAPASDLSNIKYGVGVIM